MNPLLKLREAGQGVWLDFLRRGLITNGGLEALIRSDGVSGVTSNPTIFGKAIGGSTDYDEPIRHLADKGANDPVDIFYDLALDDIGMAADVFRSVYDPTRGADGFVSFELEPRLAHDTQGSIDAARDLFARIGKPNVMIKVPGTAEGVPAVEELTALGVNVNITLLFAVDMYERVARAYISGLERRLDAGERIDNVASVASFFVSRVDTAIDDALPDGSSLRGTIAVANAKRAYQRFLAIFAGERWERLTAAGARVQRPLWASTGTKNPAYSDVLYIETLAGPYTVNTMPEQTMDAFRDHGEVDPRAVMMGLEQAEAALESLPDHGVDLDAVTAKLVEDGIASFERDFAKLQQTIAEKLERARAGHRRFGASLRDLEQPVADRIKRIDEDTIAGRIWSHDFTVWKADPAEISDRLGWLTVADTMLDHVRELESFADDARADGLTHAVLLGMGGSSLAPEVFRKTYGANKLDLTVLDTTHPAAVKALGERLDMSATLFIVASKSGTTLETLSHLAHFWDASGRNARNFVAITDPGTSLESLGRERKFRRVFLNKPDIGGRYSALSLFGLVPAALVGAPVEQLLESATEMATACHHCMRAADDPGAWLGAVIGEAARAGRDKLTFVLPQPIEHFGSWVEQLIAESTGKQGAGIVPIVGEDIGDPGVYGDDRLFVSIGADDRLRALEGSHPVVRIANGDAATLGAEMFRWEFATAVGGYVLGINPFDQPNVAEAKESTQKILSAGGTGTEDRGDLRALLGSASPGDYVAIQAYVDPTERNAERLQTARLAIRDARRVATTVGFGPRFLHSTGQLHKGGPATGRFVQVVDDTRDVDVQIPEAPYTFGALIDAQALGDLRSLRAHGRPVARVTLDELESAL
ncbi:MAG: bifunctional transaldolase/phosoglucose isomerase [Actinomycetota bacterium]